ncbi:MAG: hypothetical protein U1E76_00075 [Planctomycetota bacterium]
MIYVDVQDEGRSMYQGVSLGDGALQLMGVHVGDHVRGFKDGARAELTIDARRASSTLEFGSEPSVHQARRRSSWCGRAAAGRLAGATVELLPWQPPALPPVLQGGPARDRTIALAPVEIEHRLRFVGTLPLDWFVAGRASFECVLPDPDRGDVTLVSDAVIAELPAGAESELAAFDGSLRVRVPAGALDAPLPVCIASTAGPSLAAQARVSVGRWHAISVGREGNPFLRPVLLVMRAEHGEIRRFDAGVREFVPLVTTPAPRRGEILAELDAPAVVAIFE